MIKLLVLPLAVLVLSLPLPSRAQPVTVTTFNWMGNYVGVIHHALDPQGQVDTLIVISAFSPKSRPDVGPISASRLAEAFCSILIYNVASPWIQYQHDVGWTSDFELQMHPSLQTATLRATIPTRQGDTFHLDLSWDAAGSRERRVIGPDRQEFGGSVAFTRVDFVERSALVSGSVTSRTAAVVLQDVDSGIGLGTTHQVSLEMLRP